MRTRRTCWAVVDPKTLRIHTWGDSKEWMSRVVESRGWNEKWTGFVVMKVKLQTGIVLCGEHRYDGPGDIAIPAER